RVVTDDIRATIEYKEYEKVFIRIDVPTIPPQLVESTQGTNRTHRATRTPTLTTEAAQKKKRKKVARETSLLRKSLKVTIKKNKPSTTLIPPPSDDKGRDKFAEVTLLSLTMHKTAPITAEAQENVAKFQENILKEDIEKIVKGEEDEESYASEFADSVFQDDNDDSYNGIEMRVIRKIHKREVSSRLETRNKQMQTPIPLPHRSSRTDLSSDKTLSKELTDNVSPTPDATSKDPSMLQPTSSKSKILPRNDVELKLTVEKTNKLMKEAIPKMVNDAVNKDGEIFADVVPELVLKEFSTHAPKIIEKLFKRHIKNKMKTDLQAQATDLEMWDVLKKKFEKSFASASSGKVQDAHQGK
nr:hypothetical protein [Tanacetum cinerariifolium]